MGLRSFIRPLVLSTVGYCMVSAAVAGVSNDASRGPALTIDIPAEPLSEALTAFIRQTGLQLAYPSALADGRVSHTVQAGLPAAAALAMLLTGTGVDFTFLNSQTISLSEVHRSRLSRDGHLPAQASALAPNFPEIVVTATKREEYLRNVPVSAVVLSNVTMAEAGVKGIDEIAAMAAGVEYDFNAQWGGGVLTNLGIRGVVSKVGTSTTGIYVEDVPIQARNGNFGNPYPVTFDLARVEILRGPQSTLFGAGAEGGAIRFIPNEPSTTEFSALSRGEIGANQSGALNYEAGSAIGGPLVAGSVGARLAVWYRDDGGYVDHVDPLTGTLVRKNSNESRADAVRLSVAAEPNEALRITPSIAYQKLTLSDTSSFYESLSTPTHGILRDGKLLTQPAEDEFALASIKLEYHLGETSLIASAAYFDRTATATIDTTNEAGAVFFDGFGNPLGPAYPTSYADAVPTLTSLHQIVLSQEIRLSSIGSGPVNWTAGLFYSRAHQDERADTFLIASPTNPGVYSNEDDTDIFTSAFGNFQVQLSDAWQTRIGLRIDDARSEVSEYAGGFAVIGTPPFVHRVMDETPVTPQFDVEYHTTEHDLVYASISKGFRVGGINTALPIQCETNNLPTTYASDSLWSYEIGTKQRAFNEHLQASVSGFYLRWNNIQEHEVPRCGFGYVANAGNAIGKGLDLSLDAVFLERFRTGIAVEDVDVRYTRTILLDDKIIVDRGAVVGGVPHVPPPWSAVAYIRYQWPVLSGLVAYARADETIHSHSPGPFSELDPRSISYSPRYTADPATYLLNMRAGLTGSQWDMQFFLNNVLNAAPVLQRNADSASSSLIYAYTLRPRAFGITGSWHF